MNVSATPANVAQPFLATGVAGRTGLRASEPMRRPFTIERLRQPSSPPQVALLVSTFEKPHHLRCVLRSIALQKNADGAFEVVVSDDGSADETHQIVREFAEQVSFGVTFTTHPHAAFQVARCRNEGVAASQAPYLLFLDGDCVLPPDHVAQHLKHCSRGRAMCGYCIRLDRTITSQIDQAAIESGEYTRIIPKQLHRAIWKRDRKARFYQCIRHRTKPRLTGGNCGIWRDDFERVNGYDENFEGWGGEDTDLGARLRRTGVQIHSILRWTFTYHLWHPPHSTVPARIRQGVNQRYLLRRHRLTNCLNGLVTRPPQKLTVLDAGQNTQPERARNLLRSAWPDAIVLPECPANAKADVELLFLPGRGNFSGRADCNVLVLLDDTGPARRMSREADFVVAHRRPRHVPAESWLGLTDFGQLWKHIADS